MSGTLYGVGVGPGDPKMMTLLAVETIERCPVIAVPDEGRAQAISYQIASGGVKGLEKKECLKLLTPMTKDSQVLAQSYERAARQIIRHLKENRDVAYLTLGDPTIYSTYIYIHRLVKAQGYPAQIINGIPSFCAVAARVGESLADRSEQLHIIPSSYQIEEALEYPGSKVFMKAASKLFQVKEILQKKQAEEKKQDSGAKGIQAVMVENCGLSQEHIYESTEVMPEQASYYTTILVKEEVHD